MERTNNQPNVLTAAAIVIVVAALHFAEPVLMPLAIATLLSVVLTPTVKRVERLGIGRVASVVLICLLATGVLTGVGYVVIGQVTRIVSLLPDYRDNVKKKLHTLHESLGSFERVTRQLEKDLTSATPAGEDEGQAPPVNLVEPARKPLDVIRDYVGPIASPLGRIGLVIVMTLFMLIQSEDLRDRLIRVLGSRDLMVTTNAMDDASRRVSRYLRAYTLLNLGHGVAVATGLWLIGLPAALLFGLVSATLRFIPYLGPWVAALLPVTLSIAVFENWGGTFMVMGYLAGVELVSNNVFEPWLYGASVGLSPFAIIIAAVFWAWMWGGVGLVLAIPLTVCLVVLGRYVSHLRFLVVLLGDEPALAPPVRLFQRLLARDVDEADELVESECNEHGIDHALNTMLLPALALVDYERKLGRLDDEQLEAARHTFEILSSTVEQCGLHRGECVPPSPSAQEPSRSVLCLPAGAFGDEIVCKLASRILSRCGLRATASQRLLTGEMVHRIAEEKPDVVLLSALPPAEVRTVRYLCRRLLGHAPEFQIIVGLWGADEEVAELRSHVEDQPIRVVSSFAEARRLVEERLRSAQTGNGDLPNASIPDTTGEQQQLRKLNAERKRVARRSRSARHPARR